MNSETPPGPPDSPASAHLPGEQAPNGHADWRGFVRALERDARFLPSQSALAPWEMLLDPRLEPADAVAAVRDWSRGQRLVARLAETIDPDTLFHLLRELEKLPGVTSDGLVEWLSNSLSAKPDGALPAALTPVNLHLARTLIAAWIGQQVQELPEGETAAPLLNALFWLERLYDIRTDTARLRAALDTRADAIRANMLERAGGDLSRLPFPVWLLHFGRAAQEGGLEGRVNSLSRFEACLLSGFLHNGLGIPITLCAVVQYLMQRIAAGTRPLRVRGLNTPGHFLLLAEEGAEQTILDPFRGLYDLSWKTLLIQANAREMAGLTPENLVLEQPADILPRMTLNAITRLESRHDDLRAAEFCTLHFTLSHDPHVLLQRGLLRLRTKAHALGVEDLGLVMQSEDEGAAKLAQKFMMREDFYRAQHPN